MKPATISGLFGDGERSIIMPGEFWRGATATGLAQGLRVHGNCVTPIEMAGYLPTKGNRAARALLRLTHGVASAAYNRAILRLAEQTDASLMLTCKGNLIANKTLKLLSSRGTKCVNYYPDYHFGHPKLPSGFLQAYDIIVTTKSFHVPYLQQLLGPERVACVPHGYAPDVHRPMFPVGNVDRYLWDISYVGIASPYKLEWLEGIARAFPDRSLAIFGNGWRAMASGSPLAPHVMGHSITGDFLAKAFELSRVNIAIHSGVDRKTGWRDLVSTRTFEIPACGGFMLHIGNDEVRALFDVGTEIDVFSSTSELNERIDHYLRNDDIRRSMIQRAFRRAVPRDSMDNRARDLLAVVNGRLPTPISAG